MLEDNTTLFCTLIKAILEDLVSFFAILTKLFYNVKVMLRKDINLNFIVYKVLYCAVVS